MLKRVVYHKEGLNSGLVLVLLCMKFVKSFSNLYTYAYTLENLEVTMCFGMNLNKDT